MNCLYTILLNDNYISQIDENAFRGIEAHITGLYLQTNSFHYLPENTGVFIVFLYHVFTHFFMIPLLILAQIPNAICVLSALYKLDLHGNYFFNESKSDVFEPCNPILGTPGVRIINYSDNRVDYFPNIFTMFPRVLTLSMYNNSMRFMDEDMFEENVYVESLHLHTNQFRRIPNGLNIFKKLIILLRQRHLIENVDDNDLIGLRSLTIINLAHNPIQFITNKAFQSNIHLTTVDLSHTFLTSIPAAVTMLPALQT
ncbi:leucine-rich repeat-containing G-protein coupled receptor 4-like [Dreissena polymorpha]|uniref:leucine-rich repeat-containing G-protein coupled receptor 4-like n=1 Tax=Dreissena polymorpha TaxID=45954 RepID=UPI002264CC9C|nr:leucine-rich repeat-containing G-protein coupled receptor 4-like [Dreissena polymorpha]